MSKKTTIPIINLGSAAGSRLLANIKQARKTRDTGALAIVQKVIDDVRTKGDAALFEYTKKFDKISLTKKTVRISTAEIEACAKNAPADFKKALKAAAQRITAYHKHQKSTAFTIDTPEGRLSQIVRPLARAGVYVPGGYTMYPSSILMDVIPAQIAGVREIAVVTPPRGELDPRIAFALHMLHVKEVYQVGGAQAIAALAYGTQSIPAVDKIVGPGNLYVALAKKLVYGTVDIDAVAGPSEVVVLADASANPNWVALDLLAQAEHGSGNESALCVTEDAALAEAIRTEVVREIAASPVRAVFEKLPLNSIAICVASNRAQSIRFINECAPEHLQIITRTIKDDLKKIENAGAIFCGQYTPVALGDYYIGTNHVLPTGGAARYASPLGVESFLKRMSVATISAQGLKKCASQVSLLARTEKFVHHALSVERRAEQ
jgi:histidinol dehydrogenase